MHIERERETDICRQNDETDRQTDKQTEISLVGGAKDSSRHVHTRAGVLSRTHGSPYTCTAKTCVRTEVLTCTDGMAHVAGFKGLLQREREKGRVSFAALSSLLSCGSSRGTKGNEDKRQRRIGSRHSLIGNNRSVGDCSPPTVCKAGKEENRSCRKDPSGKAWASSLRRACTLLSLSLLVQTGTDFHVSG